MLEEEENVNAIRKLTEEFDEVSFEWDKTQLIRVEDDSFDLHLFLVNKN